MSTELSEEQKRDREDTMALKPVYGMCCVITSLFTKWPDCIGVRGIGDFLCFRQDFIFLKPSEKEKEACVCAQVKCVARKPETVCSMVNQCFCFDSRCALPCTENVPCLFNICGLTLNYKYKCTTGCCETIQHFEEQHTGAVPTSN